MIGWVQRIILGRMRRKLIGLRQIALSAAYSTLLSLCCAGLSSAQGTADKGFQGFDAVFAVVVEDLNDAAKRCHITESGLDAAMRLPLDQSRLRVDLNAPVTAPYAYVAVTAVAIDNGRCAAYVDVQLNRKLRLPASEVLVGATVWHTGSLLTGPPDDFSERVTREVSAYTREMIAEWIKANPK
ncbi:MAG: hypothetical protein ABL996_24255 [Micropepsaceae bacterium]